MRQESKFDWLSIDGVSALIRPGRGGTIVIIPGAMTDAEEWLPVATGLDSDRSVAIINRRGRAPSSDLPRNSTVADEVGDVHSLLSHMQAPYILVGWSYGGLLAIEVAKDLDSLDALILYEPVCRPFVEDAVDPLWELIDKGKLDNSVEFILAEIGRVSAVDIAALRETDAWYKLRSLARSAVIELSAISGHELDQEGCASIAAPVSVIVGSLNEDREPYGSAANRYLAMLNGATRIVLQGQGHLAHLAAPEQLAQMINGIIVQMNGRLEPRQAVATVGIIGAGEVGSQIARAAISAGYRVVIANSREPETLSSLIGELGPRARAATAAQAAAAGDFVVIAVPLKLVNDMPVEQLAGKVVLDTNNYMPWRDGHFSVIDSGEKTVHELRQEQLPTSMVAKAFTHIQAPRLFLSATPAGTPGRHALSVSSNYPEAVRLVTTLYDQFGFDTVDNSPLQESWRSGPGQPAWRAHEHQTAEELKTNLASARRVFSKVATIQGA